MSNTSNLQKTGMQMLLGRERFEALMTEADRVGLSMATVVRQAIDAWMTQPIEQRHYEGEIKQRGSIVDLSSRERGSADPAASDAAQPEGADAPSLGLPRRQPR